MKKSLLNLKKKSKIILYIVLIISVIFLPFTESSGFFTCFSSAIIIIIGILGILFEFKKNNL